MARTKKEETTVEVSKAVSDDIKNSKVCSKCKLILPLDNFCKSSRSKDGLRSECNTCKKLDYLNNREARLESMRKYRQDNKEAVALAKKKCVEAKREEYLQKKRDYYRDNKEQILLEMKEYREANKETIRLRHKNYYKNNSHIVKSHSSKRRSLLLKATPPWLSEEHLSKIKVYFKVASKLEHIHGVKYHVDHIVPLRGKLVCGLHVPWNLQVITAEENLSKGNRFNG